MTSFRDEKSFLQKIAPVFAGIPSAIPCPKLSTVRRLNRRLAFRNQIFVYPRQSLFSGATIISMFSPIAPFPVISSDEWFGDSWDGLEFGREPNGNLPIFPQIRGLRDTVPHMSRSALLNENCDFASNLANCRNCYLIFNSTYVEDSMYGENLWRSRDCLDCSYVSGSELCYDCLLCDNCYNLQCSWDCEGCSDSYYLLGCRSCRNCFGCVNLRHKEHYIWNKPVSETDYGQFIASLKLESRTERDRLALLAERLWRKHPRPHLNNKRAENSTGNYLFECRDLENCFFVRDGESLVNCSFLYGGARDCRDFTFVGLNSELMYECAWCALDCQLCRFCFWCLQSRELLYCWHCIGCKNCFACAGLRGKEYCILNKQYSREEYDKLVPSLIMQMEQSGEWGEFFPITMSAVPYNHSMAQRFFPLTCEEAKARGYLWYDRPLISAEGSVAVSEQPDIQAPGDSPLTFLSKTSGSAFRITSEERRRLRIFRAPLPSEAYDERLASRAFRLGGLELYERTSEKTGQPLITNHPPKDGWIIWHLEEYEEEIATKHS